MKTKHSQNNLFKTMAGARKETNRQKMIGMMYIVLTAFMALQVTNTVLDKFVLIDDGLQKTAEAVRKGNLKIIKRIKKSVKDRGNREEDIRLYSKSQEVIEKGSAVLEKIETMRKKIIELSGGYDKEEQYANIEEENEVMAFLLGSETSKDGEAYHLQTLLDNYIDYINKMDTTIAVPPLALNAWDLERFKNNKDQNKKDFAHINFEETPMIAALAVLSQFQNDILRAESSVLDLLANKVGAEDIPFDQVEAFVSPESRLVPAGAPYKAKVMLVASSSATKPEITSTAGVVKVGNDGKGDLEFIASANNYDAKGRALQKWQGQITINTPTGLQTFDIEEEYIVQKPTLQFVSAAIQSLYFNAGNTIQVLAPELGIHYNPTFEITGGQIETTSDKGKITIIPNTKRITLTVKNNDAILGIQKFRVKPIPKPTINIYTRNKPIDQLNGGRMPGSLRVIAKADPDFLETNPDDAQYKISEWEIMLIRNNTAIESIKSSKQTISLKTLQSRARKGDRLLVQVNGVKRKNYKDDIEDVKMGLVFFQYPITQ